MGRHSDLDELGFAGGRIEQYGVRQPMTRQPERLP